MASEQQNQPGRRGRLFFFGLPVLAVLGAVLVQPLTRFTQGRFYPKCFFHRITGYLCPGCGCTRAVLALLRGDVAAALRYNVIIPVIALLLLLYWVEEGFALAGRRVVLVPRRWRYFYMLLGGFLCYAAARNFF